MLTPARAVFRLLERDPERDGLRRAVRAAIIVPIAAAVSFQIGPPQTVLFTIFGSFALMVMHVTTTSFAGTPRRCAARSLTGWKARHQRTRYTPR
jgi:hypothetical protein